MSSSEDLPSSVHDPNNQTNHQRDQTVPAVVSFEAISGGGDEVIIRHQGQDYRLRRTRNGGLILNK